MRRFLIAFTLACGLWAQPGDTPIQSYLHRLFDTPEFKTKSLPPSAWLDNGKAYTTVEGKAIVRYETATGARSILAPATEFEIDGYQFSTDHKQLLIFTNTRKVWRDNTRGDYWVMDLDSGKKPHKIGKDKPEASLMFAKFSPDGKQVGYVQANNLYVETVASGKTVQLTHDGSATLINGTSDWVYEEELGVRDGFRWSPDGKSIAYWQFDSTGVGAFQMINNTDGTYPVTTTIPYPKTGTTNSAVRVGVVPAGGGRTTWMETPGDRRENYLARVEWLESGEVLMQQLNRLQNHLDILVGDRRTGRVQRMFRDEDKAWVDLHEAAPVKDGWLWLSERDGWRRVYRVTREGKATAITPPNVDVAQMLRVVEDRWLYYIASPETATEHHLFRVSIDGSGAAAEKLSRQAGTHSYGIAPDGRYAFHTFSTFDSAPVSEVVSLPDHKSVRTMVENKVAFNNPPVEFLALDIGGGVALDTWLIKPANFDPSKKYPVLVYVYGEPAGVTVTNQWQGARGLFHRAIANEGYIVASMDNRGTPALKGREWRKTVYGAVGELSAADQAAGLKKLLAVKSYIDPARVAVWGWSGGGSNTLNLMFRSQGLYHVGMSVAPVPDQTLYDTIYQERYMGLPKDNADGYKRGSPIYFAEGLQGKLLLVHGTGDDNVHYQGMEKLMNRLIELGKPFDLMSYPNRTHAINEGKGTSYHLHSLLARYLMTNLPAGGR